MTSPGDLLTSQKNNVVAVNALADAVNLLRKRLIGDFRSLTVTSRTEIVRGPGILIAYVVTVAGSASGWIYDSIMPITTSLQSGVPSAGNVTIVFRPNYAIAVGDTVIVANTVCDNGASPGGYNGTYTATASTSSSFQFVSAQTGNQTQAGTIFNQKAANRMAATATTIGLFTMGSPFTTGLVVEPGTGQSINVIYSMD